MTAGNLLKLCTAAIAGSIIGITFEHLPPISEWPSTSLLRTVHADSSLVPRERHPRSLEEQDSVSRTWKELDPVASAENLKQSSRFGLPTKDNIRLFNDFLISYDRRLRAPAWVLEVLTPEKLRHNNETCRDRSHFHEDPSLHDFFRSTDKDFKGSGYDRGHMAAAANHKITQDSLDQTFTYSNIVPQASKFNQGAWERLESYVRHRAKRAKKVYIITGPLYLPMRARDDNLYVTYRVLGSNHVSVPTHLFKVILVESKEGKLEMEAFLMPNDAALDDKTKLDDYRVPSHRLDVIERSAGLILFDQLNRDSVEFPKQLLGGFKDGPRVSRKEHKSNS